MTFRSQLLQALRELKVPTHGEDWSGGPRNSRRQISIGVAAAIFFLAIYGTYCIWSARGVPSSAGPPTQIWGLRLVGAACLVIALCLWRRLTWGRYVAYGVAAVTIYSWVTMTVWVLWKRPDLMEDSPSGIIIGTFITLIPVFGVVGSTIVAHRALREVASDPA